MFLGGDNLGRKRIEPSERMVTLSLNLKQKVLDEISKIGNPKHVVEDIINQKFDKKS